MATKKAAISKQVFSVNGENPGQVLEKLIDSVEEAAEGRAYAIDWKVIDNAMMQKEFWAVALVEWVS
jgi:hypothetical protein